MKVYVYTKSDPMEEEIYIGVKATLKQAEKELRSLYPHMKQDEMCYFDQRTNTLLFIHEEEV